MEERGDAERVMTALQAQRERVERLRGSLADIIRASRLIIAETKELLAELERERSRYKSK